MRDFWVGLEKMWEDVENVPTATIEELLSRYLDICTPPAPGLLQLLSSSASDPQERERLLHLATVCERVIEIVICQSLGKLIKEPNGSFFL